MATKTTTKTAAKTTAKETTMTTITMPEKTPNLAGRIALHDEWYAIISTAGIEPDFDEVENCCPDKGVSNLTDDPIEQAFLPYVCAYFGWGNELCTVSQAKDNYGTLKEGAQGWPATWTPKTTKSGPNAGKTSTWCQFVYPKEAFEWASKSGEPEHDERKKLVDAVEKAKKALARAEKALHDYDHPKAKRQTKAQLENKVADLEAVIAALKAAGIELPANVA